MTTPPTRPTVLNADGAALAVRRLCEPDRSSLLEHLLRLDDDDRRMRFLACMSDASIAAYVASRDLRTATTFGVWTAAGLLVAIAEGSPYRTRAGLQVEVSFTTDSGWRRLGLARLLLGFMVDGASREGCTCIVAQCDARNAPMRSLLRDSGAQTRIDGPEMSGIWPLLERDTVDDVGSPLVADASSDFVPLHAGTAESQVRLFRAEEPSWS